VCDDCEEMLTGLAVVVAFNERRNGLGSVFANLAS
jgi:hypothetical protein